MRKEAIFSKSFLRILLVAIQDFQFALDYITSKLQKEMGAKRALLSFLMERILVNLQGILL